MKSGPSRIESADSRLAASWFAAAATITACVLVFGSHGSRGTAGESVDVLGIPPAGCQPPKHNFDRATRLNMVCPGGTWLSGHTVSHTFEAGCYESCDLHFVLDPMCNLPGQRPTRPVDEVLRDAVRTDAPTRTRVHLPLDLLGEVYSLLDRTDFGRSGLMVLRETVLTEPLDGFAEAQADALALWLERYQGALYPPSTPAD
jgi:hypothetical protein